MKIKLTTSRASLRHFHAEGAIIDVSPSEAARLIKSGQASPVREEIVETAVRAAPELAVVRHARKGRRGAVFVR